MNKSTFPSIPGIAVSILTIATLAYSPTVWADAEFDETIVLIEINATDGDAGFHARFDAGAWHEVSMEDPAGNEIFNEEALNNLASQGLTENFFESAEPVCDDEDGEPFVTLAQFISRFPAGDYVLSGTDNEGDALKGEAELTYDLPAAPDIGLTDGRVFEDSDEVVIMWESGDDLGDKYHDQDLIDDGTISDPAGVEIVGWEVVVEPSDDEGIEPLRVFSVQLPPDYNSVTVPAEFIDAYLEENDVEEFKFEVGAIEESGNQIVLTQDADAFSELPDPPRIDQVDRSACIVKKLNELLMVNVGGFNDEGDRLDGQTRSSLCPSNQ